MSDSRIRPAEHAQTRPASTCLAPPRKLLGFPQAVRRAPATPRIGGGLRRRWHDDQRIYEWNDQRGTVAVYDRQTKWHVGEFDPTTGREQTNVRHPDRHAETIRSRQYDWHYELTGCGRTTGRLVIARDIPTQRARIIKQVAEVRETDDGIGSYSLTEAQAVEIAVMLETALDLHDRDFFLETYAADLQRVTA